jgi:cytochrome c biogenesis protein CcdA
VDNELLGLAFAAGLVAALNPCGFAMLPAYLTFVVAGNQNTAAGRPAAVGRALAATIAMTFGFLTVFGVFGALTVSVASTVQQYLPAVTVLVGVGLIAVGGWMLAGRDIRIPLPKVLTPDTRWAPTARLGSMFGYGAGYAVASLSCTVGPFLAVTGSAARTGSFTGVVAAYATYAAGFALIVGTLAVAAAFTSSALATRLRGVLPAVHRLGGALVLVVGLYVTYYGVYELRLFNGGGNPDDAVIAAAGRLQGTLAGWVHQTGGWPWLLALIVLVAAALGWAWRRRAH